MCDLVLNLFVPGVAERAAHVAPNVTLLATSSSGGSNSGAWLLLRGLLVAAGRGRGRGGVVVVVGGDAGDRRLLLRRLLLLRRGLVVRGGGGGGGRGGGGRRVGARVGLGELCLNDCDELVQRAAVRGVGDAEGVVVGEGEVGEVGLVDAGFEKARVKAAEAGGVEPERNALLVSHGGTGWGDSTTQSSGVCDS